MNAPGEDSGSTLDAQVRDAMRPLAELAAAVPDPVRAESLGHTVRGATESLARLLVWQAELHRGMVELRKVYAPDMEASSARMPGARNLLGGNDPAPALRELGDALTELKVHHAALLEGYHEAAQSGSARLLDHLDPAHMAREVRGSGARLGPFRLGAGFKPVLIQAVWEMFLDRFRKLRQLDPADFERYYRDGFRAGYQRFCAERSDKYRSRGGPTPEVRGD